MSAEPTGPTTTRLHPEPRLHPGLLAVVFALVAAFPPAASPASPGEEEDQPGGQVEETVTVTATRLPVRLADLPSSVDTWDGSRLRSMPALALDDALRHSPEFSLFRRTSSLHAHPTSQGANLRGVAPSGVSRALVLVDGVPANDPFGGWVYWDRLPLLAIDRVEVSLGGGSAPYGNHALGGVIQVVTRPPRSGVEIQALGGELSTARVGLAAGVQEGWGGLLATGQAFHTGGYVPTAPAQRGPVDTEVASSHQSGRLRIDHDRLTLSLEGLRERRDNGTPERRNDTWEVGGSLLWSGAATGDPDGWEAHGFARRQAFDSTFSAVSDDRSSEQLALVQHVPASDLGGGALGWWRPREGLSLSLGGDWRRVAGRSEETVVFTGASRSPGGTQHQGGAYGAASWGDGGLRATASARLDGWHQTPDQADVDASGGLTVSPRAGIAWHSTPTLTLRGAAYRAFRAPTLNELYRQFRVGDVVTRANPDLEAEELRGAEAGVEWRPTSPVAAGEGSGAALRLGATLYWNSLRDAVVNATLSPDDPTLRQRRNVARARVVGLEVDGRLRLGDAWSVDGALTFLEASFQDPDDDGDGLAFDAALLDNRLPQVPDVRGRLTVRYASDPSWSILATVGGVGRQFEDDRNLLPLAGAVTLDAAARLELGAGVGLSLRAENLLDHDVPVGRTPTLLLGPPRTVYGGVTLSWPRASGETRRATATSTNRRIR